MVPYWKTCELSIRGVVVAQFPNPPLIVALLAALAGRIVGEESDSYDAIRAVFYVALAIWAWEEATRGVNRFRQALGVAGIVFVLVPLANALG